MRTTQAAAAMALLSIALLAAPAFAREAGAALKPDNAEARAFHEAVGYADAVIAGDTVYPSGVVVDPGSSPG